MATMNPGGDFGKRELSPALRNRFTEVWVPHITDAADLLTLIREKLAAASLKRSVIRVQPSAGAGVSVSGVSSALVAAVAAGGASDGDTRALAETLQQFTAPMLAFVQWFDANASSGAMKKAAKAPPAGDGAPTVRWRAL
jgi:hypothetical protein